MGGYSSFSSFSTPSQLAAFQAQPQYGMGSTFSANMGGGGTVGPGTIDYSPFTAQIQPAFNYATQGANAGFDPQNALYARTLGQVTDQTRAGLAARGLNTSGVGQGIENSAISNFNIDWQNNLLGRMNTGADIYSKFGNQAQGFGGVALQGANQGATWAQNRGYNQYSAGQPGGPAGSFTGGGGYDPNWSDTLFNSQPSYNPASDIVTGTTMNIPGAPGGAVTGDASVYPSYGGYDPNAMMVNPGATAGYSDPSMAMNGYNFYPPIPGQDNNFDYSSFMG